MTVTKAFIRIAALAGIAAIAACAPEIEGRLYLEDILEVAGSNTPMVTEAQLRIPESSADECQKGLAALAEKLKQITPIKGEGACVEVDNNQFSQFDMDLPIVTAESTLDQNYLVVLTVANVTGPQGPGVTLSLALSRTLADVQDAIGRGADSGITIGSSDQEQPKFLFSFENDTRDTAGLVPNFVFIDDEPGLPTAEPALTLERRDSVKIRFSDVVAAYIAKANGFIFATIYPGTAV